MQAQDSRAWRQPNAVTSNLHVESNTPPPQPRSWILRKRQGALLENKGVTRHYIVSNDVLQIDS